MHAQQLYLDGSHTILIGKNLIIHCYHWLRTFVEKTYQLMSQVRNHVAYMYAIRVTFIDHVLKRAAIEESE